MICTYMTYINLKEIELTMEMRLWLINEAKPYKVHWETYSRSGKIWKKQREKLGLWLQNEDALIFRIKFGI